MRTATIHRSSDLLNAGDPVRRPRLVGEHDDGRGARHVAQDLRVRPRRGLVRGDDQATGVVHAAVAVPGQPPVRRGEHGRDPLAARVQRGAPGPRRLLGRQRLAEPRGHLLARAGAPARRPGVGEEDHRPHHAVGQRLRVAVRVVRAAAQQALAVRDVVDERDRVVVAAERRPGQRQAARRRRERLAHALAPRPRVARVVHLVEDHQRASGLRAVAVQHRVRGDAGVGDGDAGVVRRRRTGRVAEVRVQRDPDRRRGDRPLVLEVLGGGDDGDRGDRPVGQQLGGHAQREGGLARARRRDGQEVLRPGGEVAGQGTALPGAQRASGRRDTGFGRVRYGATRVPLVADRVGSRSATRKLGTRLHGVGQGTGRRTRVAGRAARPHHGAPVPPPARPRCGTASSGAS